MTHKEWSSIVCRSHPLLDVSVLKCGFTNLWTVDAIQVNLQVNTSFREARLSHKKREPNETGESVAAIPGPTQLFIVYVNATMCLESNCTYAWTLLYVSCWPYLNGGEYSFSQIRYVHVHIRYIIDRLLPLMARLRCVYYWRPLSVVVLWLVEWISIYVHPIVPNSFIALSYILLVV